MVMGVFEATSIDGRVKGKRSARPLTHDLIANIVEKLGGEIAEVLTLREPRELRWAAVQAIVGWAAHSSG